MSDASLVVVGPRFVTVKEKSGVVSMYTSWQQFMTRPDAQDICARYLKRLQDQTALVTQKMLMH